jgi:putative oxidoreductase
MMGIGKLALRATIGGYFFGHGMQKLAGWFGGHGPEGTGEFFEQAGLRPGREQAYLAGVAEAGGGALLVLGLFTPVAVSMLTGVMTNAIRHVHWKNGLWSTNGGVELPAMVLASLAAVADSGPGPRSLDAKLGIEARGAAAMWAALGTGAMGAILAAEYGHRAFPVVRERAQAQGLIRTEEPVGAAS